MSSRLNVRLAKALRAIAGLLMAVALLALTGCPQAATVTVTIKPFEAEGSGASGGGEVSAAATGFGNLVGTITYDGKAPLKLLLEKGDSQAKAKPEERGICAAVDLPDETLVVNADNGGLVNAIVFLEKRPANIKPELAVKPATPVFFDQKGCRFFPHVLALQAGQPLLVVSADPIPHNTHTSPKRNAAFNSVIGAGDRKGVPCNYKKPESTPVQVVCDLHPWMKAWHFPVDHPYFAVTDESGRFRIEGLPAGKNSLNIWHEGAGALLERRLQVEIEADKDTTLERKYASSKFVALPRAVRLQVGFERLLAGGELKPEQGGDE